MVTPYIRIFAVMEKSYVGGCIPNCFMLSSLLCFPALLLICYPYILLLFYYLYNKIKHIQCLNLMKTHVVSHWVYPQGGGCRDDRRGGGSPLQWCGPGVAGQHPRTDPYLQTEETRHLPSCGEVAAMLLILHWSCTCMLGTFVLRCIVSCVSKFEPCQLFS